MRKKILKRRLKFMKKYGFIKEEYKCPPDSHYPPYRKGSYFANFWSYSDLLAFSCGGINKYEVYKAICEEIRRCIKRYGEDAFGKKQ